jgi:methyltransferase family protein
MQLETDADAQWVAHLADTSPEAAARAIGLARARSGLFRHIERKHHTEGRSSYVEIDAPLELHALVRSLRPRHVVEVGVSSGVSSAYLLDALALNRRGTLHSIDLPSHPRTSRARPSRAAASWTLPPGRASGWAVPPALRKRWDLRLGDKAVLLPTLARELDGIDLFLYDVPHRDRDSIVEFRELDPRMASGAVAIVDHGPSGELCAALRTWGRGRGVRAVRRAGLGLFGIRFT